MQEQRPNSKYLVSSYYRKLTTVTVIAVFLLILAGGIVRSTGSGMGCPDWPKCFGNWVPPTSVTELPSDYQQFYSNYRHEKNVRFAKYLDLFGYGEIGQMILADESIREEAEFNASKTWTEYINRLIGVVVGFLIVLLLVGSFKYVKSKRVIFWLALVSFITVLIQGWLGSVVVSTNLLQWLITLHMILALVIVCLLIALYYYSHQKSVVVATVNRRGTISALLIVGIALLLIQIVFGTQVRESLDIVAEQLGNSQRDNWIDNLGLIFIVHRSFSLLLLAISILLFYFLRKANSESNLLVGYTKILVTLFIVEILSGAIMAYFAIPFWIQPLHLLLGTLLIGWQFYMLLLVTNIKRRVKENVYAVS
ncbi:hypothetical protein GCM10027429_17110 [Marivirga atlantica]|jgi:cytochrome c oxidase assembly protein subunit 15|uniref:COX15/CtaA family protein n=1 Tax=Marivirga atlantica TaxID=1548457 RepID=A0A937AMC9_9BACT|nr:COX15/CtaA family protein [Marivirga atlantica]MBL0765327.1 COX15/CtaA family protein [Marivirga atlantica]